MEEDVGIKVTVTRLRRRLSVEQSEDGNIGGSPGPATPTKKRGGRLAAKPQLELIEENTPVSSPRKTRRKSLATDAEEKAITPSRRSVRIKSNTSIVSDTLSVQATASPRAIRAARRYSQTGSDNEGPATPARQTRQTRKDSASSLENQESGTLNKPLPVAEIVIEEEPENEVQKAVNISVKSSPTAATEELSPNARKSKRLLEKRNRSGSQKTDQDCSCCSIENKGLNISTKEKVSTKTESHSPYSSPNKSVKSKECNDDLSEFNLSLLNKLETKSKGNKLDHNKSASALDTSGNENRNRTESWPVVAASTANESMNFSDNELSKKKKEKSNRSFSPTDDSSKNNKSNTSVHETNTSQSLLDTSSKRKQRKSETNIEDAAIPCKDIQSEVLTPKATKISDKKTPSDKSGNPDVTGDMVMLFENRPENVQISVYYEDSDSNTAVTETANQNKKIDSEDQCVPEVVVIPNAEKSIVSNQVKDDSEKMSSTDVCISQLLSNDVNNSCEPMDIDETIHVSQSLSSSQHSIIEETENSKRKSSISGSTTDTPNPSKNYKRKSSLSNTAADTPDQSKNDKRKSSMSNTAVDTLDKSKNNKRKSSISNTAVGTPDQSKNNKRKSSISNTAVGTPDQSKNDKRKSSISNTATYTPDQSKNDKRKSSISNTAVDTPDQSKNYRTDTPDRSKNNSTADTPDLSKNDNNKSTLILSQLKDVSTTSENLKIPKSALINEVLSKSDINETDNKKVSKGNLSLNDVKGTPKQYSVQKLTMQTSTPIASQQVDIKTKVEEQKQDSASKKKSIFSKSINDTDSSEEDSDDELSTEKNEHLDDEAEEASGDYESGDSQDEEEKMYVAENEIVVRGETLTSDDDASNDTDYEKDSFVVSSDAEDNGLLSGSGDDLSMSDNELSMSRKSKKKFNDRKIKEQKNASREMFESRHKLNSSDKNSPSPKTNKKRMRIDSSLSDEEVIVTTKKPNRMRLDSTLDSSVKVEETNVSLNKSNKNKSTLGTSVTQEDTNTSLKKKKNKSMQDSICNESAIDENEITVCNESAIENADPLQIQIKHEPKTPQKDLNISVVQVQQDIEGVQMTESNSILDQTGTDPLQATMACEYTSDSSESEEILQNYDSVLNELNKDRKTKLNNKNASLNMGKTSNKKEPIIDQLNLTEAKKSKKNKVQSKDDSESKTVKLTEKKQDTDNEDSSSSIDLQLLFSEDNCGSDDEQMSQPNKTGDDNMFIPLKKSPGKTNLRDSIGMNTSQKGTTLNESSKKNKKRNSSIGPAESVDEQGEVVNESILNKSNSKKKKQRVSLTAAESQELEGTLNAVEPEPNESTKKKKKRESSLSAQTEGDLFFIDTTGSLQDNKDKCGEFAEPTLNNVYEREKKKKKNKLDDVKTEQNENTVVESNAAITPKSGKKKKKHSISEPSFVESQENIIGNAAITPKSEKKKKKHSISEPPAEETQGNTAMTPKSEKKKKKHSTLEPSAEESPENTIGNAAITPKSEKKKKKHSISEPPAEETQGNTAMTPKSEKKKKKHSTLEPSAEESPENAVEESNAVKTPKSEKKKKQKLESLVHDEDSDGAPDEVPYQSEKASEVDLQNTENVSESEETSSAKKKQKKKKKKKSSASNQSGKSIDSENVTSNSKKRKRKSSNAEISQEDAQEVVESGEVNKFVGSNKKLKISHNEDNTSGSNESKQSKKNKKKNRHVIFQDTAASTIETTETQTKKNKKRKHRDEDGDRKQSKVSKDSSFQEVHVPRLPDSILRQLDDKPRKIEPATVVSTSNFIVENARRKRAKPSNYLEESIYLDAKSPLAKKDKCRINKPKVLPFIPTASTSDGGFTTNFKINKLSHFTTFEAEPVVFSKENYLQKKKIKRLGTYDRYKTQMHHKMSKF